VEDDAEVRGMLGEYLASVGHAVTALADGKTLRALREPAEVYLLDVNLPGEDGLGLARWLRESCDPAIVMLTAAGDVVDRIVGLEIGADDYIVKPVAMPELGARIEAVLRRRGAERLPEGTLAFGRYRFDLAAFGLTDETGARIALQPMETDLVAAFATNPGRVLSRDDLLRLAPPRDGETYDRAIDHRITRLRRKLEDDPAHPQLIRTVRGGGYLFPG